MRAFAAVTEQPRAFGSAARAAGALRGMARRRQLLARLPGPLAAWLKSRDLPVPAAASFRSQWRRAASGRDTRTRGGHGA